MEDKRSTRLVPGKLILRYFLLALNVFLQVHSTKYHAEVAVYNGHMQASDVWIKGNKFALMYDGIKSESTSDFKVISEDERWNVTLRNGPNAAITLLSGCTFKSRRRSVVVIYEDGGIHKAMIVDAGDVHTPLKGVSNDNEVYGVDKAGLTVVSKTAQNLTVYWRFAICYKCSDQVLMSEVGQNGTKKIIGTKWPIYLYITTGIPQNKSCSFEKHFEEHGEYETVVANEKTSLKCITYTRKSPDQTYSPIAAMFGIIAALIALYLIWIYCIERIFRSHAGIESDVDFSKPRNFMSSGSGHELGPTENSLTSQTASKAKKRLKSLDAFRGVAITVMIFVNYQGGDYYFFEHSIWNGLTVADLVFPWFIFIMGTSIDLSQRTLLSKGVRKWSIFQKIIIRSFKLFAIGLFLNNGYNLGKWRIPGVLQRFGISYFVVATVSLWMSPSEEKQDTTRRYDWTDCLRDLWMYWTQWVVMIAILVLYLLITFLVHEDGCPRGYLGPGGLAEQGKYQSCTGGAAGYIDRLVFGNNHMYGHPTCKKVYNTTLHYDPEGILGCLTSIFLTFMGLQSGRILFTYSSHTARIKRWLLWGAFWGILTFALTSGSKDEGVIPINKNLWSPSYIFATGSMAYILLCFMYVIIDVMHWWTGVPFTFAGMNAILLYCGHEVFHNFFPFNFNVKHPTHATILARSSVGVAVWMIVAYYCYVEKIFFKV